MKFLRCDFVVHDHQQVMIAVFAPIASRPRTEQDHLARVEMSDNRLQ